MCIDQLQIDLYVMVIIVVNISLIRSTTLIVLCQWTLAPTPTDSIWKVQLFPILFCNKSVGKQNPIFHEVPESSLWFRRMISSYSNVQQRAWKGCSHSYTHILFLTDKYCRYCPTHLWSYINYSYIYIESFHFLTISSCSFCHEAHDHSYTLLCQRYWLKFPW